MAKLILLPWLQLEGNKAYSEMLTKIYKELMILGFIAFAVILAKEFGMAMSPEKMHCFEFCDLLVSICVLLCARRPCCRCFVRLLRLARLD